MKISHFGWYQTVSNNLNCFDSVRNFWVGVIRLLFSRFLHISCYQINTTF